MDLHLCNLRNFESPKEWGDQRKQGWIVGERELKRMTLM